MCIRTMSHGAWTMDYALPRPHPTPVPPSPRETGANHSGSCMQQATPLRPPPRFALTAMEPIGANSGQIQP